MDLDQDGHLDLLSGSYPGELYLFRGTKDGGFEASIQLKDKADEVINVGRAAAVYASDWDADGDLDLVVGDIRGQIWFVPNGSGSAELQFGAASQLASGEEPIRVPGGDAGPAIVDWDGDGSLDLIVGCGDGSVRFYANGSARGLPVLAESLDLVATRGGMGLKTGDALRGGARVKVCVTDWNGDGRLDLLTGDVLMERLPPPELTAEDEKERDRAQAKVAWVQKRYQPAMRRLQEEAFAGVGFENVKTFDRKLWETLSEEQREKHSALLREYMQKDVEFAALSRLMREAYQTVRRYQGQSKIHGHVWLYVRAGGS